jgi:hypothetical protein
MRHRWLYLALGGVFAIAACSDQGQAPSTAPEFKVTPDPLACDFGQVKNLVNSYFSPPNQAAGQLASGYESSMEDAGAQQPGAISNGFAIMDLVGRVSRSSSPSSVTVGNKLSIALTKCMFDAHADVYKALADGDGIDSVRFDLALNHTGGGVYYVVGNGYDISTTQSVPNVLKGKVGTTKLSAAAPGPTTVTSPLVFTLGNWTDLLDTTANAFEGRRALVYAYPVSQTPIIYEWATIDPLTVFRPYALVSICDNSTDPTQMVIEAGVGALAFSAANLCGLPDGTGTAGSFRSHFNAHPVTGIQLEWITPPPAKMKVGTAYPAKARATFSLDGVKTGVNGSCLILSASNNNGIPLALTGTKECDNPSSTQLAALTKTDPVTNQAGYATYSVTATKSGGVIFTLSGFEVVGRAGTFQNTVQTKTNVGP